RKTSPGTITIWCARAAAGSRTFPRHRRSSAPLRPRPSRRRDARAFTRRNTASTWSDCAPAARPGDLLRRDSALEIRREPTGVAFLQLRQLPVAAAHDAPALLRAAEAGELVVVVGVGHRVVEAQLFARGDGAPRDEQHRPDDPAVGIARVVHAVARVERRHAG